MCDLFWPEGCDREGVILASRPERQRVASPAVLIWQGVGVGCICVEERGYQEVKLMAFPDSRQNRMLNPLSGVLREGPEELRIFQR